MTDRVFVSNLCLHGHHGVLPEETKLGQRFYLDIDCAVDLAPAARDDDYGQAVCYASLCRIATEISDAAPCKLIETLADRIARAILSHHPTVLEARVRIRKPSAPIPAIVDTVGVEIRRQRLLPVAFSVGSNIGDKRSNLDTAFARLGIEAGIEIEAVSSYYRTAPWGNTDQDWFLNACGIGWTSLSPMDLLRRVKALELEIGRVANTRWGPRMIDIDILHMGSHVHRDRNLNLPHADMFNRAFVMVPLAEIAGDQVIAGRRIADAATALARQPGDVELLHHRRDEPFAPTGA